MIGVNSWPHKPGELKEVMTEEQLNWRSFADDGTINRKWNSPATPTFYVLDPAGSIRHKWVGKAGDKVVDAALEKLIEEAEKATAPR